ncbi:hypothetical protein KI387_018091 [Taxus chinensis]|uniref:C2H2-type domain-containing protein n=1 Tax=Taxus chinensis TaxID=29808 RepID=A0AA38LJL2_TAXCH|nr:hypothetical protein KI387_018091 [Taxus chinensis]
MDDKSKKAMFRSKLKESAQKREKRIDSPLVRYNELDQAVCRVCNVVIKSESLWPVHLASRKHKEAVEDIKARAAKSKTVNNSNPTKIDVADIETHPSSSFPAQTRPASTLPTNFFDQSDAKRQTRVATAKQKHRKREEATQSQLQEEEDAAKGDNKEGERGCSQKQAARQRSGSDRRGIHKRS